MARILLNPLEKLYLERVRDCEKVFFDDSNVQNLLYAGLIEWSVENNCVILTKVGRQWLENKGNFNLDKKNVE